MIKNVNNAFYNASKDSFNKIPFDSILPELLLKYAVGKEILEIGSASGVLASWLVEKGFQVTCIEPAEVLAKQAEEKGLPVYIKTIQEFETDHYYDNIVAISSLIHVPKSELPAQIKKMFRFLKPQGVLFVSFIEGEEEGLEDPTNIGKLRYFAKYNDKELDNLFSCVVLLENHKLYNKKMNCNFILRVYKRGNL